MTAPVVLDARESTYLELGEKEETPNCCKDAHRAKDPANLNSHDRKQVRGDKSDQKSS